MQCGANNLSGIDHTRLNEILSLEDSKYNQYLRGIPTDRTHEGYFSVDKRSKRLVDPETAARSTESDDVDAYDLILKDKERLLSFAEPTRFIFSHSVNNAIASSARPIEARTMLSK